MKHEDLFTKETENNSADANQKRIDDGALKK